MAHNVKQEKVVRLLADEASSFSCLLDAVSPVQVMSFGGGVQSVAILVLSAQGKLPYKHFLFANVGDDSEYPGTLEYFRHVALPFAESEGLHLWEVRRRMKDGTPETLIGRLRRTKSSISIPIRMQNGAPGNRTCTTDFKIKVIAKELKEMGATKENPGIVGIGISTDEAHRANNRTVIAWERTEYPLLKLRLSRSDCARIIRDAGLPEPPKSACWFCPFHRPSEWQRLQREEPELFQKAVELERFINERRRRLGKDSVWLTRFGKPLDEVFSVTQTELPFELDNCESGYCMT
ncbi:MAG: phosphoadenosine phosphosulfate reductase [Bacteroidetes bacterium]|nr:phosphoadenosine phosphosulfate reductase [Bacteroidota bacterium]